MEEIPSAEEFYNEDLTPLENMVAFAKAHRQAILEHVKNNILHKELSVNWKVFDKSGMLLLDDYGVEDFEKSILNAYPLSNIK